MPLFYVHLRTPHGLEEEDMGISFPNLEHAYLEVYRTIPPIAADLVQQGLNPMAFAFVIADAAGTVLTEVPFTEALGGGQPKKPTGRFERMQRLSQEIAAEIVLARETTQRSREILARARTRSS